MGKRASTPGGAEMSQSAVEGWLQMQPSRNTRAAYRSDLETFGRWCAQNNAIPLTADESTLVAFQLGREIVGDSDSTLRRRWSALSSFYDFAVEREMVTSNPAVGAERPRVASGDPSPTPRLSPAAVAAYRAMAAALDPRLHALVALLVSDGLKVGEALALDVEDVAGRPPTTSITVRRHGESRRIVIDRDSAKAIRRCIGQRRDGPVFVSERAGTSRVPQRLTRFGADYLIRQLRTNDGEQPVTANALRRFHFSTRDADGIDHDDVRDGAGLADVRSVRRYTNKSAADAADAADEVSTPTHTERSS